MFDSCSGFIFGFPNNSERAVKSHRWSFENILFPFIMEIVFLGPYYLFL